MSAATRFLLRKDPALKGLAASVPILTGIGLAIRFSAGEQLRQLAEPGWTGFTMFMFMVIWGVTLFHTVGTGFWSRSSRIAMVLPIPARDLWIIRTLAVAAAVLVPLFGMTAALAVGIDPFIFLLVAKVMAVLLLLLALSRSPYPKLFRVPVNAVYVVFLVFLAILALVYLLITPVTPATILIPAALAVLITLQSYLAVPRGFLAAPDRPGRSEGSSWWGWLDPPDLPEEVAGAETEFGLQPRDRGVGLLDVDDRQLPQGALDLTWVELSAYVDVGRPEILRTQEARELAEGEQLTFAHRSAQV